MSHRLSPSRWDVVVIGLHLSLTAFFALQLPRARLDNDVANFIPLEHPSRATYKRVEDEFGGQMVMLIGLQTPGKNFLTAENLRALDRITRALEHVTDVGRVSSLTNARDVEAEGQTIRVRRFFDPERLSDADLIELRRRLEGWEVYRNGLVSQDLSAVQILLEINVALDSVDGRDPKEVVYREVKAVLDREALPAWEVFISGTPVFAALMSESMRQDLVILVPLVFVVLTLTLALSFRRPLPVILTLLTVAEASIWSVGAMALLEVRLSLIATVIPVILVAVGSAYAIHVLTHALHQAGDSPHAVERAVQTLLRPVLLAALTTLAGFGSLTFTEILPVRDFGLFACVGVMTATLAALTLVPALLRVFHPRLHEKTTREDGLARSLVRRLEGFYRRPALTVAVAVGLLVASLAALPWLVVDNALVEYFHPDSEIARSDRFLRQTFAGTKTFSLVFSGPQAGSLTDPRALAAMDATARHVEETFPAVGKTLGLHHLIKRMNQVFQVTQPVERGGIGRVEADAELPPLGFDFVPSPSPPPESPRPKPSPSHAEAGDFYEIPLDPSRYGRLSLEELQGLIHDYLLLLGDSTEGLVNDPLEPSKARLTLQLRTTGNLETELVSTEAVRFAQALLPEGYTVEAVGVALIEKAITDLIVQTQIANLLQSLVLVFLIVWISHRGLGLALLSLIPLALALPLNFAVMSLLGIRLNMATAMVSSIAVGVGIDYTIHILEALKRALKGHADTAAVLRHAVLTSGRAILVNALSVALGFSVLVFSRFQPLVYLGLLIALTMISTSAASLTVVPSVLILTNWRPLRGRGPTPKLQEESSTPIPSQGGTT